MILITSLHDVAVVACWEDEGKQSARHGQGVLCGRRWLHKDIDHMLSYGQGFVLSVHHDHVVAARFMVEAWGEQGSPYLETSLLLLHGSGLARTPRREPTRPMGYQCHGTHPQSGVADLCWCIIHAGVQHMKSV